MASGKRRKPSNFAPSTSFLSNSRDQPREQFDDLMSLEERLRVMQVQFTRRDFSGASKTFTAIVRGYNEAVCVADIHVKDIGVSTRTSRELAAAGIHTIQDISNLCAAKMVANFSALDALEITLCALRKVVSLERERA